MSTPAIYSIHDIFKSWKFFSLHYPFLIVLDVNCFKMKNSFLLILLIPFSCFPLHFNPVFHVPLTIQTHIFFIFLLFTILNQSSLSIPFLILSNLFFIPSKNEVPFQLNSCDEDRCWELKQKLRKMSAKVEWTVQNEWKIEFIFFNQIRDFSYSALFSTFVNAP